ncbi:2-oxoglutarate and iron-dependent oxygenase domain-containing protein [soil metagenome]
MAVTAFTEVPAVDLTPFRTGSPAARRATAHEVGEALEHVGFLSIVGHGVDPSLFPSMVGAAQEFFALPVEQKALSTRLVGGDPGWYPLASSTLAQSLDLGSPPDLKEAFGVAPIDRPPPDVLVDPYAARWFPENRWPEEPVGFTEVWVRWYRAMEELSATLLEAFAVALDLPDGYFAQHTGHHTSTASMISYPALRQPPEPGQLRAGGHTDYGTLTILHKAGAGAGLQVVNRDGDWIDVRHQPLGFIVNIGDLMARWTNDRWVSTMHRVVNPTDAGEPDRGELSFPYFHQPDHDCTVAALPTCVDADHPARYEPIRAGDHLASKVDKMHAPAAS